MDVIDYIKTLQDPVLYIWDAANGYSIRDGKDNYYHDISHKEYQSVVATYKTKYRSRIPDAAGLPGGKSYRLITKNLREAPRL